MVAIRDVSNYLISYIVTSSFNDLIPYINKLFDGTYLKFLKFEAEVKTHSISTSSFEVSLIR